MAVCRVGGNGTGREARWDVGPVNGAGGGAVGAEAEAVPVGESPVCVAGARTGEIVEDHGAEAVATDPLNHRKTKASFKYINDNTYSGTPGKLRK